MKKACAPDGSVPLIVMTLPLAAAVDELAYRQAGSGSAAVAWLMAAAMRPASSARVASVVTTW